MSHAPRRRKRLREDDHVREIAVDARDQPLPEGERLRVRVIDAKDAHALLDPEAHYALELLPQRLPVLRVEIDRVNVFVALWRVLGVADRAVRPVAEPLRV